MRLSTKMLLAAGAVLCGAMLLSETFGSPDEQKPLATTKVAVCDVVQVFNNYQRAKDLTQMMAERRQAIKTESEKRAKAVEAIQKELEGLKPGSKEYESRFKEAQRLSYETKAWAQFQEAVVLQEHRQLTQEMYEEILAMIAKVAKAYGIQIVLYSEGPVLQSNDTRELLRQIERRKVLYNDESVDLTDEVLARIDEAYRLSKG